MNFQEKINIKVEEHRKLTEEIREILEQQKIVFQQVEDMKARRLILFGEIKALREIPAEPEIPKV